MADWTEKYRPTTLAEVRGNDKARDQFQEWAEAWDEHGEAAVLHGSPGVGKTSAAHALANDMEWEVVELNASDQRTKDDIERYAGRAAGNATLGGSMERARQELDDGEATDDAATVGRQLIVLDEADNMHGNVDRGGAAAITRLVKDAEQPVVLIANDYYEMSNALRRATQEIEFRDVSKRSIVPVLRDVCRKENVDYEEEALEAIAESTSGDLRSAINDLQALTEGDRELTTDDVVTGERDRTKGIFDFLDEVIKEKGAEEAMRASYDVDETPDDLINWLDENVPKDFEGDELADAYGFLSNADRWLGRVHATQNYSFWRYASDNMVAGVAAARGGDKGGWTRYSPPSYWSRLGRTSGTRKTRDYVARKVADEHAVSVATARREILPYLAAITHHCKNREATVAMAAKYELDAEHVSFVTGSGEDTNKVQDIVAEASERRGDSLEESEGFFDADPEEEQADGEGGDDGQSTLGDAGGETDESNDDGADAADDARDEPDDDQAGLGDFV
ncbi:AAA family ATPase [Halobacteriales archaeon QS_1_68_20]|nr:MAG: AAA family ATPase [Halobacteriales archaeon QS_1_68_20]